MEKLIYIEVDDVLLKGMLKIPDEAQGLVLFAHGSGSSRHSPRNNFVADILRQGGLATLLIDLLASEEDEVYETRFDISLLSERLIQVVNWIKTESEAKDLPLGLFGSSTGAAAALEVAASLGDEIKAVVSRGGRPDLAKAILYRVVSPTLFIVGERDDGVLELNQQAYKELQCVKNFDTIPRATHLFEEPGCLEQVARLAQGWFKKYLRKSF